MNKTKPCRRPPTVPSSSTRSRRRPRSRSVVHRVRRATTWPHRSRPRSRRGGRQLVATGLSMEIPEGCYGRIAPRSGLAWKHGIQTGAGVIDADYRGEVKVLLFNHTDVDVVVDRGARVAQLVLECIRTPEVLEVPAPLDATDRGAGGSGRRARRVRVKITTHHTQDRNEGHMVGPDRVAGDLVHHSSAASWSLTVCVALDATPTDVLCRVPRIGGYVLGVPECRARTGVAPDGVRIHVDRPRMGRLGVACEQPSEVPHPSAVDLPCVLPSPPSSPFFCKHV